VDSALSSSVPKHQLTSPAWLAGPTTASLIFALKTFAAALLGLFIAFWAGLDDPRWAFLTVFIVSQPESGLVLAKGFYRILGTIAGLLVTTALVFAFSQYGELFLAATAVWICFCSFAARAVRSFASYGFQLAGYTVAIVGIPAAMNPIGAYPLILARVSEILLGIICAVLVSRLILVTELSPKLIALVRSLADRIGRFPALLLDPKADADHVSAERTELISQYLQAEEMQRSAYFECAEARLMDRPLRRVAEAAVQLWATAEAAAVHRLAPSWRPELRPKAPEDGTIAPSVPAAAALLRLADDRAIDSARADLQTAVVVLDSRRCPATAEIDCKLWSDPIPAILAGIRSALAIAITSALWFATAWPHGPVAVIVAAVACTLLAPLERPDKVTTAAAITVLITSVLAFVTQFHLLPVTVDFLSMAVALAPLGLAAGFILGQPRIGPLGLLAAVYFAFVSNIDNVMTYDAASFLNSSLAILIGIGVSIVLFATFFPETPVTASRRFRRQLLVHLRELADPSSPRSALVCYRQALYEQLGTTLSRVKDEPSIARQCIANAIAALAAAESISRLQVAIRAQALLARFADEGSRLLARLSQTLRTPSVWKLTKRAAEARDLCRRALSADEAKPEPENIEALEGLVVACEALGDDLLAARVLLEKMSNAARI